MCQVSLVVKYMLRILKKPFPKQILKFTPDMRQSKTLLTTDKCGSKIARNSVFDCHLSPAMQQMAIENCF